ncbi:Xanthine/uracil/thiamine/ascorbate permease family protein [Caenispirillum salinarum AK4]|uniref:Xanthine/uracil/thiamine/ascorbate permease family protein n=1 Tax=Caenispirillum salinarum AK4 TaxID=1238182 RepID=K9GXU4_9PROT|nr:NCS2 family permease [Caenispirillum salinarum]EKV30835.1 Xanthine/uracil/thiamine/ascorbate permease family protein [Caenispirillum salinarum AK4]
MLDRLFGLTDHGTTVKREVMAGATTFLTMAYIVFVNPSILADAGIDRDAAFVATCLAAAFGSAVMGLWANYPIALAPGMGVNAFFAYSIVLGMGYSWQIALGAVFWSGVVFVILSLAKVREAIINAIPQSLKMAIAAGIGFFLGSIGLTNAGIIVANEATFVGPGDLTSAPVLLAVFSFVVMVALDHRKVPGAIIIGILLTTAIAVLLGFQDMGGVASLPPSVEPTFLQMDIMGALEIGLVTVILSLLFIDMFDTAGTLIATSHAAGLLDEQGRLPRMSRALLADSSATVVGAGLGTSTTTSYIESLSGIRAGGRTGLTAVVVAGLFLLALFLAPLAGTVPAYATAAALVYVACLMAGSLREVDWHDVTEFAPAVVTALSMPLTFSISEGIGFGFIVFVLIKVLAGRWGDLNPIGVIVALLFAMKFAYL